MKRKLGWFGLAFALAELFAATMPSLVLVPAAALFGLLVFFYRKEPLRVPFAGALAGLAFFAVFSILSVWPIERYAGQQVSCQVVVETDAEPSYQEGKLRGTLLVTSCEGVPVHYRVTCDAFPGAEPGECFSASFFLEKLDQNAYQMSYRSQGVYLQAEYTGSYKALPSSRAPRFALFRIRQSLARALQSWMPEEEGALASAMLLAEREGLSASLQDAFRAAGVSHLLAVSGLHVALLCGIFSFGYRRRFLRPLILLRAFLVLLYMLLTGLPISVMRAGIVFLLALAGDFFLQPVDPLTSTGVAAILIGLQNAYAPCDVGFQLSFCAVLGVQLAGALGRWEDRVIPVPQTPLAERIFSIAQAFLESAQVAFFASLATMPVLIAQKMTVSGVGILTNLLVVWMLAPALKLGIIVLLLVPFSALEPVAHIVSLILSFFLSLMVRMVYWCAELPAAQLVLPQRYTLLVLLVLAVLGVLFWKERQLPWFLPVAAGLVIVACVLGVKAQQDVVRIALVGAANNPCAVCIQNHNALILFRGGQSNWNAVTEYLAEQAQPTICAVIDIRQDPSALDFGGTEPLRMEELPVFTQQEVLDDVMVDLYHGDEGNLVVLGVGNRHIALATGNIELSDPVCVDVLCVAASLPDRVKARTLMYCTLEPAWLPEVTDQVLYRGTEEPTIVIRPGKSFSFEEVKRVALQ